MAYGGIAAARDVGAIRGIFGASGGVGVSRVYWWAGRECRYSGARRGIDGIRGALGIS